LVVARLISSGEPEVNKQSLGWMEALVKLEGEVDSSEVDIFQGA
jgi:hypothetical protein